jgi:hypothetical protein
LDWEINSVTIWGKVFLGIGALYSRCCQGKGVLALGWSLGASQCGHEVGTLDGSADSRHECHNGMQMAADDGAGAALDRGSLSQEMGCSRRETRWAVGRREMGEKVGRERKMGVGGLGRLQKIIPKALYGYKIVFHFKTFYKS